MKLSDKQRELFDLYYEILTDWNSKMNLTAITDKDEVWLKHFEDSLSLEQMIDLNKVDTVIDVGTGAGFPGIPLKIVYPHLRLTLLDSLDKRVRFLDNVINQLGLQDVEAVHGRAEDMARQEDYREKFDLCVSRAVAALPVLTELCVPFVKVGGFFVSYKAERAAEEIEYSKAAIDLLGATIGDIKEFRLSGTDNTRTLIRIDKSYATSDKYPRRAGIPSKKPLK